MLNYLRRSKLPLHGRGLGRGSVSLATRYCPVECLVGVVEEKLPSTYLCLTSVIFQTNSWDSSVLVRHPRQQPVQHIFCLTDYSQIFYAVVVFVAIHVINGLCRQLVVAQCPGYAMNERMTISTFEVKVKPQVAATCFASPPPSPRPSVHDAAILVLVIIFQISEQLLLLTFRYS